VAKAFRSTQDYSLYSGQNLDSELDCILELEFQTGTTGEQYFVYSLGCEFGWRPENYPVHYKNMRRAHDEDYMMKVLNTMKIS